ncbi:MAG: hypothetical protein HUJ26_17095 [Planctomycetaceae bacterium]|nr:hypothetical protein [Planctomycetaceae bacterium]
MTSESSTQNSSQLEHEPESLDSRWISSLALGLLGLVVLISLALFVVFELYFPQRTITSEQKEWQDAHAGAGVIPNQAYDREQLEDEQQKWLNSFV